MKKTIKISWNRPGGGASKNASPTAKISIPTAMMRAMDMMGDEHLVISVEDGYIKIEKITGLK